MKYAAVADWVEQEEPFSVVLMCEQLGVSRSGFYDWCRRLPTLVATSLEMDLRREGGAWGVPSGVV